MTSARPVISYSDPRTGKTYSVSVGLGAASAEAEKLLMAKAEHDYQKTLPPDRRANANRPTSFRCPFCKTNEAPSSRKVVITNSGFFWSRTRLEDIFLCGVCSREFTYQKLQNEREDVRRSNARAVLVETFLDGELSKDALQSALVDKF